MDIQSFIQSGLLEAYVLGQCTDAERLEVERMAAEHPDVKAELDAIEQALEKVALANAVPPPPGLKELILQRIEHESRQKPASPRNLLGIAWLVAAAFGMMLAWQFFSHRSEMQRIEAQVAELQTRIQQCDTQQQAQIRMQQQIAFLGDRDTKVIILEDKPAPDTKVSATVWYNIKRSEVKLDLNSLPAPDRGRYFQFWAIVDGKPVSMGMVARDSADSWQNLPFVQKAQAFAISAEDKPEGNPTPTMVIMVGAAG